MRTIVRTRKIVQEFTDKPRVLFHGKLLEDYDGIGQWVSVTIAGSSIAAAYKAKLASGDFGSGRPFPAGTPVLVASLRGQLEVISLGGGFGNANPSPSSVHVCEDVSARFAVDPYITLEQPYADTTLEVTLNTVPLTPITDFTEDPGPGPDSFTMLTGTSGDTVIACFDTFVG